MYETLIYNITFRTMTLGFEKYQDGAIKFEFC